MVKSRSGVPAVPPEVLAEPLLEAAPTVRELVDGYIVATVDACGGDKRAAARRMGVSHVMVYDHLNAMELARYAVANE